MIKENMKNLYAKKIRFYLVISIAMKTDIKKSTQNHYQALPNKISQRYNERKVQAIRSINVIMVSTNWDIGRYIIKFEQGGNLQATYGTSLLKNLAKNLTLRLGILRI